MIIHTKPDKNQLKLTGLIGGCLEASASGVFFGPVLFWPTSASSRFSTKLGCPTCEGVQVNLCQKLLILHQLTHNMITDCSWNYEFSTWKFQAQNMGRTCYVHTEIVFDIHHNFCTQHVLRLQFSCTELVIPWTIFCHIVG